MDATIATLHPQGKQGARIDYQKYRAVRRAILEALRPSDGLLFKEMMEAATDLLPTGFRGSPNWYITTVKLDLEARGWLSCERKRRQTVRSVYRDSILQILKQIELDEDAGMVFDELPPADQQELLESMCEDGVILPERIDEVIQSLLDGHPSESV